MQGQSPVTALVQADIALSTGVEAGEPHCLPDWTVACTRAAGPLSFAAEDAWHRPCYLAEAVYVAERNMRRVFICDGQRTITVEVEVCGPVLRAALGNDEAEDVIRCAILMALSVLAEGGEWPGAALYAMGTFMTQMKAGLRVAQLV